jgi:hypothetical protein
VFSEFLLAGIAKWDLLTVILEEEMPILVETAILVDTIMMEVLVVVTIL